VTVRVGFEVSNAHSQMPFPAHLENTFVIERTHSSRLPGRNKKGPPHTGGPICAPLINSGGRRQRQLSAWVPAAAHCHKQNE
jgi:hypothetical protein